MLGQKIGFVAKVVGYDEVKRKKLDEPHRTKVKFATRVREHGEVGEAGRMLIILPTDRALEQFPYRSVIEFVGHPSPTLFDEADGVDEEAEGGAAAADPNQGEIPGVRSPAAVTPLRPRAAGPHRGRGGRKAVTGTAGEQVH
jgi:hypothetical protein